MTQYIGNEPFFGFIKAEEHTSVGANQYTLGRIAPTTASIEVVVNGVVKRPSEYSLSGKVLTLAGVPSGQSVMVRFLTTTGTTSTYTQAQLADNIVTTGKILDNSVTNDKIVSVDAAKLTGNFGGTFQQEIYTGNGVETSFLLTQDVAVAASILVTVSGVQQISPNHYTLSGTGNRTLTFNTAPANNILIHVLYLGVVTDIGVPSGGTLTPSMFAPGTIPVKYSTNPTVTSAESNGYSIGTEWINTTDGNIFVLTDDTAGANVWLGMGQRFDTMAALVGGQRGAVITYDSNGNWVVLAPGTAGQKLTSGGFSKDASWVGGWEEAINNKTITKSVVVASSKFVIDGVSQDSLVLAEGNTYKFNTSNASVAGHTFKFATVADAGGSTQYTTGVTEVGTPGTAGAYTQIVVASGAPDLYYYCSYHNSMGGTAGTTSSIPVDPNNDYIVDTSSVAKTVQLPATPTAGDAVRFVDKTGSFDTNRLTIDRNGKNINRQAYNLVLESGSMIELVYASATDGWVQTDTDGADWKHLVYADGVITTTYAASALDTLNDDRTSDITVTTTCTVPAGPVSNLVDGGHAVNSTDSWEFSSDHITSSKYIQFAFDTKNIITGVRMYGEHSDTVFENPKLTVNNTAESFTVGETITGSSSGATGVVILGAAGTTTVTYTESSGAKFTTSDTITGGTSGFSKTVSAVETPQGTWQWQGSATGVWGGEEVNIGTEWALHNEGLTGGNGGYIDRTELSANTTGYKYYRMVGVRGAVYGGGNTQWLDWYFTRQEGTDSAPTYDAITNTSYMINTTAGTFTVKLPTNPAVNDYVDFADQASKFATNKLTVGRNGKNIQTLAEDLEINVANSSTRLTYTGTTNGWVLS